MVDASQESRRDQGTGPNHGEISVDGAASSAHKVPPPELMRGAERIFWDWEAENIDIYRGVWTHDVEPLIVALYRLFSACEPKYPSYRRRHNGPCPETQRLEQT